MRKTVTAGCMHMREQPHVRDMVDYIPYSICVLRSCMISLV